MNDTNLLDDPIILQSIQEASDELLRRYQSKENQTIEQRLESVERKIDFLLEAVQSTRPLQVL